MKKNFLPLGLLKGQKIFFSSDDPEKKILLYIGKWINGKFSISGLSGEIFTNQVNFWEVALGGQCLKFVKNFQIGPNPNAINLVWFRLGNKKLAFTSKSRIRVGCHAH